MPDNGENSTTDADATGDGRQQDTTDQQDSGDAQLGDAGKQALDRMKAERNEAKRQAIALQKELEKLRQASMSEAEKAIAEAEAKGRTAATAEFGKRLAKAAIETAAAKRNPDYNPAGLDFLDLSKFIGEDGEPDAKAISAYVESNIPATSGAPSFDGGARLPAPKGGDMNSIIRRAAGHG